MSYNHECRYCNQKGVTGYGCPGAPDYIHEDIPDDPKTCIRCGSTNYGSGCPFPINEDFPVHKHGHGDGKCVWCGRQFHPRQGCSLSPTGYCEK